MIVLGCLVLVVVGVYAFTVKKSKTWAGDRWRAAARIARDVERGVFETPDP